MNNPLPCTSERNEPTKGGGVGVETERSGAEVPVRWEMLREKGKDPRCWTIQSHAERGDRGQTEKSWLLFEEIDTFLYDLTRKIGKKSPKWCGTQ